MGKSRKTTPEEDARYQQNIDRLRELARRGWADLERKAAAQPDVAPPKN
jgi:hypothetical protein